MEPNELPDELAGVSRINTYITPPGYFEGLAEDIIGKVHLPLLTGMPSLQPPPGYFDGLADAILSKIKITPAQTEVRKELEEIEPLLNLIAKTNVYRVPEGYFESFSVNMPEEKKPAAVLNIKQNRTWLSYAAAAVVAGAVALGVITYTKQQSQPIQMNYAQALAKVTDVELSAYLEQPDSDADIIAPQEETGIKDGESIFKVLMNRVSDTELENYLKENEDSDEKKIKGI